MQTDEKYLAVWLQMIGWFIFLEMEHAQKDSRRSKDLNQSPSLQGQILVSLAIPSKEERGVALFRDTEVTVPPSLVLYRVYLGWWQLKCFSFLPSQIPSTITASWSWIHPSWVHFPCKDPFIQRKGMQCLGTKRRKVYSSSHSPCFGNFILLL